MTRSILLAGLLGGLLGGAASFAAGRWLKPPEPPKSESATGSGGPASPEARQVAEAFVAKLRAGKFDEFALDAKVASAAVTDQTFAAFKARLDQERLVYGKLYGRSTGEFELLRETVLSPHLVRFAYLEKFENGGVIWFFILYRGSETWRLSYVDWSDKLALAFSGIQ